ncbi:MAG: hypothetical protein ACRDPO_14550 [Streptosporangiaceae bacterium]
MTGMYRRSGRLAVLVTAAAIGLAACGGSARTSPVASLGSSSGVASLGKSGGNGVGSATTSPPKGNATRLLDQWAACMRSHGDPNQTDPTVDTSAVIHITTPAGDRDGALPSGQNPTNGKACIKYLAAAQLALRSGRPFPAPPSQGQRVRFSECMRANGVPDFPDPSAGGDISAHPGGDMSPNSPAFQNAARVCARKTGTPGFGGRLPAGAVEVAGGPAGSGVGLIAVGPVSG